MRRWEGYVNVLKQCRGPWADCQKIQSAGVHTIFYVYLSYIRKDRI